jgi:tetratricopeptide (TPR) repeat protein
MAAEFASSLAGLLALRGELEEAWTLADESARSRTFDVAAPVQLHSTRARILALRGADQEALCEANRAIRLAEQTDLLNLRADTYRDFGDVLEISQRSTTAMPMWARALALYSQKGNRLAAAQLKARLLHRK